MQITALHSSRRHGAPASRDAAIQLAVIRQILAAMPSEPEPDELGRISVTTHSATVPVSLHQHFAAGDLDDRLLWANGLTGEAGQVVLRHLRRAQELGPMRRVASPPSHAAVDALERDFPHGAAVMDLLRRRIALGNCSPSPTMKLPPLLLSGKPGSGKTALAKRLAAALDVPCREIDMASLRATFTVVGLDVGYTTGRPGALWEALQTACMSPVVILDELDKAGLDLAEDPTGFLYSVLEPLTARRFTDAATGLPVDASWVSWIATCNDHRVIHPALLSRFTLVELDYPTPDQMVAVVESIHRDMIARSTWAAWFDQTLSSAVVRELIAIAPREVVQTLEDAHANAAIAGRRSLLPADVRSVIKPTIKRPIGFVNAATIAGDAR